MSISESNYEYTRICVMLQSEEKKRRTQGLKEILKLLEPSLLEDELSRFWGSINKSLLKILNDNVEACRDLALEILKLFLINLTPNDKYIVYLLPILSKRLGSAEQIESSEEVRFKCVTLLNLIISRYKDLLITYVSDLTSILTRTVTDNYPLIKRKSCECISEFAKTLPSCFYTQSSGFVKPIISNFTHQHYKVRISSIYTIGDLIQYGDSKCVEEVVTPLAEKLFDQNGLVRAAVIDVAGSWLLKLRDRYSWWHRILPLLLTGLHDELEEIRQKAANYWDAAGQLYIQENQNDEKLKDKLDFLDSDLDHYPDVVRPNLGCRMIAQLSFSKLINGINLELRDWLADIRVRTAQLLCVFALHLEEEVIQQIGKLLPTMYLACTDEDNRVVDNVEKAAEYFGYFIPPKTYCRLIIPSLEDTISVGQLKVFAAILKGSNRRTLSALLNEIGQCLAQPHICQSKKAPYQKEVLSCCYSLILVCKEDCKSISKNLFVIIFTVLSMTQETGLKLTAQDLLSDLGNIESFQNLERFYEENVEELFPLFSDYKSWTVHSPGSQIFAGCFIYIKRLLTNNMEITFPILKEIFAIETDPELKLQYYILLSEYFNESNLHEIIDLKYVNRFLEDCILPGLIWSAGRTAEAIRTAAVSCLCVFLDRYEKDKTAQETVHSGIEDISSTLDKIIPVLISLADDNSKKSRYYSLRAMYLVMCVRRKFGCLTEEYIHKLYPILLKRLDDGCDNVRWISLETLTEVWDAIPTNYDLCFNKSHVDYLYTTAIIYLDDPEIEFQAVMLGSLKKLAKVYPQLLYEKLKGCKLTFRNQTGIDDLLEHCRRILKNE